MESSARDSQYAAVDEWDEDGEESDGEDWPYGHAYPPPGDAGRRLDLSHLPRLQYCRLQQLAAMDRSLVVGLNYRSDTVTVHLAAPQLTCLALFGGFRDVLGLQDSTQLQEMQLMGCVIGASRLTELLAATPSLLDFSWDGTEGAGYCDMGEEGSVLSMSLDQQRQLAVGLSAATQLTALSLDGLTDNGWVEENSSGVLCRVGYREPPHLLKPQGVRWGLHLQGLRRLQRLELVSFGGPPWHGPKPGLADVLALTALSALTHLRLDVGDDVNDSVMNDFRQQMPGLANCEVNGSCVDAAGEWGTPYAR